MDGWSTAAEKALADAFQLAGGPVPSRGLVLGRGMVRLRTVRLGGPIVRSVRRNAADVGEVDDVSLYRDSSAAPVLDLRRKLKAVLNLLDAIVRCGASLSRDVELSHLWDCIVRLGPLGSVSVEEYVAARACGVGESRRLVAGLYGRVSIFVRGIVAHRRNVGITAWRSWLREDPLVHLYRWLRADRLPPSPFLQCDRVVTPGGAGVVADPPGVDEEFRKAWLPYLCRSGQRETSLDEFNCECDGWLPRLGEFSLPALTGDMLFDVVRKKSATAGSLDGWGWRELKALPVAWFHGLGRILFRVEDLGVWPDGFTPDGSGVLSDPYQIDAEFRKAWLPYFCRSGQRETSLAEFGFEVDGWLPLLPEVHLPRLTCQVLADVVHRKGVSAGGLDGWWWRELKVLPVSWFDGLARILTKVEELGVWPHGLLDAYIAMIPKVDGDATPLGQRLLSVLPVVHRVWASAWMLQLEPWFRSWVPSCVFSAGGGRSSVEAWFATAIDIEEVLSGVVQGDVHVFVADVIKYFDTVDRGILDSVLSSLGFAGLVQACLF